MNGNSSQQKPNAARDRSDTLSSRPMLRLLGRPAWSANGTAWTPLARPDAALLALLALHGAQPRGRAASLLWPDASPPRASANLRQRLYRLRKQRARLVHEDGDVLSLDPAVACDLDDSTASGMLLESLIDEADGLQPWVDEQRRRWESGAGTRLAAHAARLEASGQLAEAIAAARHLVEREPLHEHGWRLLMQLHVQRGDRAAALAAFERCERILRDELGVRPSPPTLALLHRVETLAGPPPLPALPPALLRPPPLVGRERERAAMAAAWQAGRPFLLVGEAGVGKTRLLGSFAADHPGCVLTSARPGDEPVAYGLIVRLLRTLERGARRSFTLWASEATRAELARLLPEVGEPPAAPGLQALLHDAVEQALAHASDAGVHSILLDDLQHADDASLALLRPLLAVGQVQWGLATRPAARVEAAQLAAGSARIVRVEVGSLTPAVVRLLLERLAIPELDLVALAPALQQHCGGNPLFLLETLRHLCAAGPPQADGSLPLPASVQALLADRLAALPAEATLLAQVAAVAGPDFNADLACDVLAVEPTALAGPWQTLQAARVLDGEAFTHDALRDAVLAGLPPPLRGPLHGAVAASLLTRGAPAARVLRHFAAARRPREAAAAARAAADEALRLGRIEERLELLEEAARWSDEAGDPGAAFRARAGATPLVLAIRGPQAAAAHLQALDALATDAAAHTTLALEQAALALQNYDVPRLLAAAQAALVSAVPGSVDEQRALASLAAGQAWAGDAAAEVTLARLRPALAQLRSPLLAMELWGHVATAEHARGRPAECLQALQAQRAQARATGHAEVEASVLASLAGQQLTLGDADGAVAQARSAVALQRRLGAVHTAALSECNLLIALIGVYRLDEALALSAELARHMRDVADHSDLPLIVGDLRADIWLRLGDVAAARAELRADPPPANAARRVNRLGLRALADGDPPAWQALRAALPAAGQGGVRLRMQLMLAARGLAGDESWGEALAAADTTGQRALAGLAWLVRTELAVRRGDRAAALEGARTLQQLHPQVRHLYVDEALLRATVCRALDEGGATQEAQALRRDAVAWADSVLPGLPATHRERWRLRADLATLWAG